MELSTNNEVIKSTKPPMTPVLIVSQNEEGKPNIMTAEWYMRTSIEPPMFAISIGNIRHTHKNLSNNRLFNINVPASDMAEVVKYCGTVTGKDTDKIDELNLGHFKGKLGLPLFKDAKAGFECKVISQILSGDHTIFIGEVKYCWLNEEKSTLVMYPQK